MSVDELRRLLFNTRGQAIEVIEVEVLGQIALNDRSQHPLRV